MTVEHTLSLSCASLYCPGCGQAHSVADIESGLAVSVRGHESAVGDGEVICVLTICRACHALLCLGAGPFFEKASELGIPDGVISHAERLLVAMDDAHRGLAAGDA
jgi:hypothetical protein